jgi:hypothetical protein
MTGNRLVRASGGRISIVLGTVLLAATFLVLTIAQRDYLRSQHWSPVHRTPTEWPSLLATGPHGWLLSATFATSALLMGVFALSMARYALAVSTTQRRFVVAGVLLAAIGLVGIAFPADPATAQTTSWHARVHNSAYPLIPLGVLITMLAGATARGGSRLRSTSRCAVVAAAVFFGLTNVDSISQLARYPAFATLLVWLVLLSEQCLATRPPATTLGSRST